MLATAPLLLAGEGARDGRRKHFENMPALPYVYGNG
jgi:hypothetical protein